MEESKKKVTENVQNKNEEKKIFINRIESSMINDILIGIKEDPEEEELPQNVIIEKEKDVWDDDYVEEVDKKELEEQQKKLEEELRLKEEQRIKTEKEIEELRIVARRGIRTFDYALAKRAYGSILMHNPVDWEGLFYLPFCILITRTLVEFHSDCTMFTDKASESFKMLGLADIADEEKEEAMEEMLGNYITLRSYLLTVADDVYAHQNKLYLEDKKSKRKHSFYEDEVSDGKEQYKADKLDVHTMTATLCLRINEYLHIDFFLFRDQLLKLVTESLEELGWDNDSYMCKTLRSIRENLLGYQEQKGKKEERKAIEEEKKKDKELANLDICQQVEKEFSNLLKNIMVIGET